MATLYVHMFGKFRVQRDGHIVAGLEACKLQELFGFLLINRHRAFPRETLAVQLSSDSDAPRAKKHLRQTLWELQAALSSPGELESEPVLLADAEWVQLNPQLDLWLDVADFELAYRLLDLPADQSIEDTYVQKLEAASRLYTGQLMENCYQDWCLFERERLHGMYAALIDRLIETSEARHDYRAGLAYGKQILRYDRARERTHRQLMRLFYLAGDRTAALRQYHRCVVDLQEELGVAPSRKTKALYEKICLDQDDIFLPPSSNHPNNFVSSTMALCEAIAHLKAVAAVLTRMQMGLLHKIETLERSVKQ